MFAMKLRSMCMVLAMITGLLCLGTGPALGETIESPELGLPAVEGDGEMEETPNATNPPAYILELAERIELPDELQLEDLRADGMGWGEIWIAIRLAEQMVANSGGTLDEALKEVLAARAEGKGFGEIAGENNLKIGELVANDKAAQAGEPGAIAQQQARNRVQTATAEQKKPGFLARLGRAFGWGRAGDKAAKPEGVQEVETAARGLKAETPGKPAGVADLKAAARELKGEKPERAFRPERAGRPERLEIPEKPAKPERPEKGPPR
jgi:hypothetical protein